MQSDSIEHAGSITAGKIDFHVTGVKDFVSIPVDLLSKYVRADYRFHTHPDGSENRYPSPINLKFSAAYGFTNPELLVSESGLYYMDVRGMNLTKERVDKMREETENEMKSVQGNEKEVWNELWLKKMRESGVTIEEMEKRPQSINEVPIMEPLAAMTVSGRDMCVEIASGKKMEPVARELYDAYIGESGKRYDKFEFMSLPTGLAIAAAGVGLAAVGSSKMKGLKVKSGEKVQYKIAQTEKEAKDAVVTLSRRGEIAWYEQKGKGFPVYYVLMGRELSSKERKSLLARMKKGKFPAKKRVIEMAKKKGVKIKEEEQEEESGQSNVGVRNERPILDRILGQSAAKEERRGLTIFPRVRILERVEKRLNRRLGIRSKE